MAIFVEAGESLMARATLRNPSTEPLNYIVRAVLTPTGSTTVVAESGEIPVTIAGGQTVAVDMPVTSPANTGMHDSYLMAMYQSAITGMWEVAMASFSFEGVQVYEPGLEVINVEWV